MTYRQVILIIGEIRKDLVNIRKDFTLLKTIDKAEFIKRLNTVKGKVNALLVEASQGEITGRKKKEKIKKPQSDINEEGEQEIEQ